MHTEHTLSRRPTDDPETRRWIHEALALHEHALMAYALRLVGDVERARDLVQETFLRLWEADRAAVEDHLAAWLFTVCRRRALDIHKKERRMLPTAHPEPEPPDGPPPSPLDTVQRRQDEGRARRALATLPERQQELVRLKFQAGLSYEQIAQVTGLTVSNVGYLLHTALKAVKSRLGGDL